MNKIKDESERRIAITIKRKYIDEAKALGFSNIDAYIEHLRALLNQNKSQSEAQSQSEA